MRVSQIRRRESVPAAAIGDAAASEAQSASLYGNDGFPVRRLGETLTGTERVPSGRANTNGNAYAPSGRANSVANRPGRCRYGVRSLSGFSASAQRVRPMRWLKPSRAAVQLTRSLVRSSAWRRSPPCSSDQPTIVRQSVDPRVNAATATLRYRSTRLSAVTILSRICSWNKRLSPPFSPHDGLPRP